MPFFAGHGVVCLQSHSGTALEGSVRHGAISRLKERHLAHCSAHCNAESGGMHRHVCSNALLTQKLPAAEHGLDLHNRAVTLVELFGLAMKQ